jgi:hypothetical protein
MTCCISDHCASWTRKGPLWQQRLSSCCRRFAQLGGRDDVQDKSPVFCVSGNIGIVDRLKSDGGPVWIILTKVTFKTTQEWAIGQSALTSLPQPNEMGNAKIIFDLIKQRKNEALTSNGERIINRFKPLTLTVNKRKITNGQLLT